jgi:glucose-6-phosphate isomerase
MANNPLRELEKYGHGAHDRQTFAIAKWRDEVAKTMADLDKREFASRLWKKDVSLWSSQPDEAKVIRNSLGWLTVTEEMAERADEIVRFAREVVVEGFEDVVLIGMGGSSLSPLIMNETFGNAEGYPRFQVIDSTVPAAIAAVNDQIDPAKTLFVVSSKSGDTVETISLFEFFREQVRNERIENSGGRFVAITDPGTNLERIARDDSFRRVFLNPPDIGGRNSALSLFGLVPAALMGIDIASLLDRAGRMAHNSAGCIRAEKNAGVSLGAVLATLYKCGRDKLTLIASPGIESMGLWIEQLIAESTGKNSKGIVPVYAEPPGTPNVYGDDRLFVYSSLASETDPGQEKLVAALEREGHSVIRISLPERIDLGEEFMRWQIAAATAAALLGVNPFIEPDVDESKRNTMRLLQEPEPDLLAGTEADRHFEDEEPADTSGSLSLYCTPEMATALSATNFVGLVRAFVRSGREHEYFAILAYLPPRLEVENEIDTIRAAIRDHRRIATTFGYGPRYLHSTGQLHKGGPNTGLFLELTMEDDQLSIPGQAYTFEDLSLAQSIGDFRTLLARGRRVMRIHINGDLAQGLARLREMITKASG